jgi:PHD/YefM family antitoxin component YafN of YafNO toxin-antitoxin module
MQTFTASEAKQNFGALLSQLAHSPVAIARHNKTVAVIMLPAAAQALRNPRLQARAEQQQREQQRLMRHQQVAIALLCATPAQQALQLQAAQAVVARWASEGLCSADYIDRWQAWLALPLQQLAPLMCGDAQGWGPAMRQNSPFGASAMVPNGQDSGAEAWSLNVAG